MDKIQKKIAFEKKIISQMVKIYCKKKHGNSKLCDECLEILNYASKRIDNCKFIDEKTFCSKCESKCYSPKISVKIKEIMRFSGKWMLLYHPILVLKHIFKG